MSNKKRRDDLRDATALLYSGRSADSINARGAGSLLEARRKQLAEVVGVANGLIPKDAGVFEYKQIELNANGIFVPESVGQDALEELLKMLLTVNDRIQLWIGDLLNCIHIRYGKTYEHFSQELGIDANLLYDYKWVASRIEFSVRTENLTFSHYRLLASKDDEAIKYWIGVASDNNLSVRGLKEAMKAALPAPEKLSKHALAPLKQIDWIELRSEMAKLEESLSGDEKLKPAERKKALGRIALLRQTTQEMMARAEELQRKLEWLDNQDDD